MRDQHCRFPGCDTPAAGCDVHHLVHRKDGGRHALTNLALLCRFHHLVAIHRWGWHITLHPDGTTTAISPDGTKTLHSHPPPGPRGNYVKSSPPTAYNLEYHLPMAAYKMNSSPASEREALAAFLDRQRDILVRKIEGVSDEDTRKTPAASSLSLLGILKHCALWERRWFQVIVAGRTIRGEWPEVKSNWMIDDSMSAQPTQCCTGSLFTVIRLPSRAGSWPTVTSIRRALTPGTPIPTCAGC